MRRGTWSSSRIAVELALALVGSALLAWAVAADRLWYERHLSWTSCSCDPRPYLGFVRYRWAAGSAGALLLVVLRPWLGRLATRKKPSELAGAALRIGLAVVASVVVADLILRIHEAPSRPLGLDVPLAVQDPALGWRPSPGGARVVTYGAADIGYVTDAEGARVRSPAEPTDVRKPSILFVGESITHGFGLAADDGYPARVAHRTGLQAVNLGITGYSQDQAWALGRRELARLDKPIAVVSLVVQIEILRNTDRRVPHFLPLADGSYESVPRARPLLLDSPIRDLVERKIGLHSTRHFDIGRDVIEATTREARARGAYPLFVFTNWREPCLPADDGGLPTFVRELTDGLDASFVYVPLAMSLFDKAIDHPNADAHALLAERIDEALAKAGVVHAATSSSN